MKTYIRHSFISKLPLFIIIIAILFTIALASSGRYDFTYPQDFTTAYSAAIFVIAIILPLFGMSYRYSLRKSDLYRQVAFKHKSIRIADNLLILGVLLISFIITYPILCYTTMVRNYMLVGHEVLYYAYLVPQFFFMFVLIIITYGFSYAIVSLANNVSNSIILLLMIQILFFAACGTIADLISTDYSSVSPYTVPFIIPSYFTNVIFGSLLTSDEVAISYMFSASYDIPNSLVADITIVSLSTTAFVGIGIFGLVKLLVFKDPSSEWAGKAAYKSMLPEIIYHVAFIFSFGYFASTLHIIDSTIFFIFIVLMISLYYTLYGLMRKNFKLNKIDCIKLGSSLMASLLLGAIVYIATNAL